MFPLASTERNEVPDDEATLNGLVLAPAFTLKVNEDDVALTPSTVPSSIRVDVPVKLIDVRRPEEFNNELGHIEGAKLVTLGPELTNFLQQGDRSQEIVFVCRSGGRSGHATVESQALGYKWTSNMVGGMIRWNEAGFPVSRN
jgi:rhodanese-related sulfurtransferase